MSFTPAGPRRSRSWRAYALGAFMAAGGLFATTSINANGLDLRASSVTDLDHVVRQERDRTNDLQQRVADLNADVSRLSKLTNDTTVARLQRQIDQLEGPAGLLDVAGSGLTVTLDDAPRSVRQQAEQSGEVTREALVIHQQDIQAVVNALWAGGAEAISINDQRIVSTTGIKCVGNVVILHGLPYSPPYRIKAIGDPTDLQAGLDDSDYVAGIIGAVVRYQLGYDVERSDYLQVDGFQGSPLLKYAERADLPAERS